MNEEEEHSSQDGTCDRKVVIRDSVFYPYELKHDYSKFGMNAPGMRQQSGAHISPFSDKDEDTN